MSNMENVNSEHAEEKTKTKKKWITPKTFPYILVFPAVFLFAVFTVYPVISSFILSFQASEGGEMSFIGFQNYIRLFNDGLFYQSLINTFTLLIIQVPVMITLAILLAVTLNSALVRFNGFFRIAFFLPSVTALVTASIIFIILLDSNYGIVNYVLSSIGLEKVSWLNDPFWAKVSIMLVVTWRWTGYNMVILLAGLQNVSQELYESASIDGAGKLRQFFHITLPQLKPVILFTVVLSTIGTLQLFDEPYILTNGGPNNSTLTVIMYLYDQGFRYFDFGYASAIAYVLVIIIAVLSWIQLRLGSDRD